MYDMPTIMSNMGIAGLVIIVATENPHLTDAVEAIASVAGKKGGEAIKGISELMKSVVAKEGFESVISSVIKKTVEGGKTKEEMLKEVEDNIVEGELKTILLDVIQRY